MGYVLTHIPTVPSLGPCVFRSFSYPFTALLYIIKRLPPPPPQPLWAGCPLCSMGGIGRTVGWEGARSQGISPFRSLPSHQFHLHSGSSQASSHQVTFALGSRHTAPDLREGFSADMNPWVLCGRHPGGCALSAQTHISFTIFHSKLIF